METATSWHKELLLLKNIYLTHTVRDLYDLLIVAVRFESFSKHDIK